MLLCTPSPERCVLVLVFEHRNGRVHYVPDLPEDRVAFLLQLLRRRLQAGDRLTVLAAFELN